MKQVAVLTFILAAFLFLAPQAFADSGHHAHNHAVKASTPFDAQEKTAPHCPLKHKTNTVKNCPHTLGNYINPGAFLVSDCHGGSKESPLNPAPQLKNLTAGTLESLDSPSSSVSMIGFSNEFLKSHFGIVPTPPPPSA